jgi:hypothetical protein
MCVILALQFVYSLTSSLPFSVLPLFLRRMLLPSISLETICTLDMFLIKNTDKSFQPSERIILSDSDGQECRGTN